MDKKEIIALVNKGLVTACGLLSSEKVEKMTREEFYDKFVPQAGAYTEDVAPEPVPATLVLNVPATALSGVETEWEAIVTAGDYAGVPVIIKGQVSGEYNSISTMYNMDGQWVPIPVGPDGSFVFGAAEGFPLIDDVAQFKTTTLTSKPIDLNVSLSVYKIDDQSVIATATSTTLVNAPVAPEPEPGMAEEPVAEDVTPESQDMSTISNMSEEPVAEVQALLAEEPVAVEPAKPARKSKTKKEE